LVYNDEGKKSEALTLALVARDYATADDLPYIEKYIDTLSTYQPISLKKWNFSKLLKIQLIYPAVFFLICLSGVTWKLLYDAKTDNDYSANVKQVVVFNNGQKTYSDVAAAKIFDIPVDVHDKERLYHITEQTNAMHGPDKDFDIFQVIEKDTTVRITGYTIDKRWYRVMFDKGDMAFIEANKLEKGIGKAIPLWSKIYKED
jgi:uncharacterized pyridoxamine 5'-phosphate oxidase family protein